MRGRYELPRRWYRLKAQLLGLDRLADYDRMAAVTDENPVVRWREARDLVQDSYSSFSPELGDLVDRFFDEHWIDAPVRPGKRGGAFCSYGVPSVHPYVMLNYTSRRRDVLTLAHELGHGVHAALGGTQGVFHMATPLTLAETASVFGETLVFGRLLEQRRAPESRLSLLAESIEGSIATVFRQVAMNRFEHLIHTERREEGELSLDRIGDAVGAVAGGAARRRGRGHRGLPHLVVLRPPLHRVAGLRLRVRLRAAARAGGLRPLRGGGRGVRARLPRAAERRRLEVARGARRDRRRRPRRPGLLGQAAWTSSSASSTPPSRPRATPAGSSQANVNGGEGSGPTALTARPLRPQCASRAHRPRDDPRQRGELVDAHPLVDRVGELDPGRADHHGRDAAGGEQAHVGAPGHAGEPRRRPSSARSAARDGARPTGAPGRRLAGRERAARPLELDRRRLAVVERRPRSAARASPRSVADRHAEPALEHEPVGHRARPLARPRPARRAAGRAARASRISGCSTSRLTARSCAWQREVDARRSGRSPSGPRAARGVGGAAAHGAPERQRAGLGADDAQRGRLGDQAASKAASRSSAANVPSPPSSSEATACSTTSGVGSPRRAAPRARAARRRPRPSCRPTPRPCSGRPRSRPTTGRGATARCPARRRRRGR